jgi:hypothetical protein
MDSSWWTLPPEELARALQSSEALNAAVGQALLDESLSPELRARLFEAAQLYRDSIRQRPPLPFDPSMIGELTVIHPEQRLRRILAWFEAGVLTPEQLNELLAEWWTSGGWPADIGKSRFVRAFKYAGFVIDTEGVTPPTEPLVVYRGAGAHNYRGLAWTTDERVAAWFARRLVLVYPEMSPVVLTTTIAPKHVLGIFHGRNEAEAVVNVHALRGLDYFSGVRATDERVIRLAEEYQTE